jgi:hypothetical protein
MRIKCFECEKQAHHNHHVVPRSRGGKRTIPLCRKCHGLIHTMDISEMAKLAWEKRKKSGKRYGQIPWGMQQGKTRLVKNKKEQRVIQAIKTMHDKGMSSLEIAKALNLKGHTNRAGEPLTRQFIRRRIRSIYDSNNTQGRRTAAHATPKKRPSRIGRTR